MLNEKFNQYKYHEYFYPEIKLFLKSSQIEEIKFDEFSEDFDKKRKVGQSDSYLAKIIRDDDINEFVIYINKYSIGLSSQIKLSVFETNLFLLKRKKVTLIEYAAFFGSIQIFQNLIFGKVELKPSLWLYVIHGANPDMIHLLETNQVEIEKK